MTTSTVVRRLGRAVWTVLPAWLTARVLVTLVLVAAHLTVRHVRPANAAALARVHQGLLAWDGGWYFSIAHDGYRAAGQASVRFFPAYPLLARFLAAVPGVSTRVALVCVSNLAALGAMALLWLLVERDFATGMARRSVWLLALAPSAFCLVLGYSDALLLLAATLALYAARTQHWVIAAVAGFGAGLTRPLGILVAAPLVVEAYVQWRRRGAQRSMAWTLTAVGGPLAGTATFMLWCRHVFGDALLPFRVQEEGTLHGPVQTPFASMGRDLVAVSHGHHVGSALHLPWVVITLWLLVVAFRRLPASYAWFAASVLVVCLATANLDSFERYALGAFPLVVAASTMTERPRVERAVLVVSALAMAGYAYLSFVNISVP